LSNQLVKNCLLNTVVNIMKAAVTYSRQIVIHSK